MWRENDGHVAIQKREYAVGRRLAWNEKPPRGGEKPSLLDSRRPRRGHDGR